MSVPLRGNQANAGKTGQRWSHWCTHVSLAHKHKHDNQICQLPLTERKRSGSHATQRRNTCVTVFTLKKNPACTDHTTPYSLHTDWVTFNFCACLRICSEREKWQDLTCDSFHCINGYRTKTAQSPQPEPGGFLRLMITSYHITKSSVRELNNVHTSKITIHHEEMTQRPHTYTKATRFPTVPAQSKASLT